LKAREPAASDAATADDPTMDGEGDGDRG